MTLKDRSQSREHAMALLVHRREITANAAKGGGSRRTAKGARNLLLYFCHPQVPLGLIVGKRNPQVIEPCQHLIGTTQQRIQQILGLALLAPPFLFARRRNPRRRL